MPCFDACFLPLALEGLRADREPPARRHPPRVRLRRRPPLRLRDLQHHQQAHSSIQVSWMMHEFMTTMGWSVLWIFEII